MMQNNNWIDIREQVYTLADIYYDTVIEAIIHLSEEIEKYLPDLKSSFTELFDSKIHKNEDLNGLSKIILDTIQIDPIMIERLQKLLNKFMNSTSENDLPLQSDILELIFGSFFDTQFALEVDPAANSFTEVALCYPGIRLLILHRLANFIWKKNQKLIARIISSYSYQSTSADIHPAAQIGVPCFIDHVVGTVIGETTEIGKRVIIYHGVTLGAKHPTKISSGKKRHPKILDDVKIYSHSSVLGGNTIIGNSSVVNVNSVVLENIQNGDIA